MYYKVLFMEKRPEQTLSDIRQLMERSTRFRSINGFSFVAAGICGLLGAEWIRVLIRQTKTIVSYPQLDRQVLVNNMVTAAICTLLAAIICGFFFTWFKMRKRNLSLWEAVVRKAMINFIIPMITGGILIIGMMFYYEYQLISASCLLFYGLSLVNASHYTLKEIRYLGICEILIGIICLLTGYNLLSLIIGFGVLNILSGLTIWYKYR